MNKKKAILKLNNMKSEELVQFREKIIELKNRVRTNTAKEEVQSLLTEIETKLELKGFKINELEV